ncbi:MAG: hypothetical protein J5636_02430 [Clostridiales bacterium]|nr:hypothetical protein [Clostridiales bacterium]
MKKSYIVALICIGVVVIGMIAFYFISTYGPGSENAEIKKRVEYLLESYGARNDKSGTWSSYEPKEEDLDIGDSAIYLCKTLKRGKYETEEEARANLLAGVYFKIDKVEKEGKTYVVTVTMTRLDQSWGTAYIIFDYDQLKGEYVLMKESGVQAMYVGNGIGGSGDIAGDILDYVISL